MRQCCVLICFLIGLIQSVSFGQVDSQYPLSILWPTNPGNHTIAPDPSGHPYKFVNINNVEIS